MINIFKTTQDGLKEISEFQKGVWIRITNPKKVELEEFQKTLNFPLSFLLDPLDVDERARIEKDNGHILIIIRIPCFVEENTTIPFQTLPLGLIINHDYLITICNKDIKILSDFSKNNAQTISTDKIHHFLFKIFMKTSELYLKDLKQINDMTNEIEAELCKSMRNEELIKLLDIEKCLVFFTTSLKANEFVMERLSRSNLLTMAEDDKEMLNDVIVENKQAIEMANIYSDILSSMRDAFASVISNNLNVVMKFLTSVTIILMLPTLVASVYGMNVPLPFQDSPHAFLITIGISFLLSGLGVWVFIKRRFF